MGVEPGVVGAMRGCMPAMGELVGETGDAESSDEEESETDSARPRRVWMGMGLLWGTWSSVLEAMETVRTMLNERGRRMWRGAEEERSFRRNAGSDAVYEARTLVGVPFRSIADPIILAAE